MAPQKGLSGILLGGLGGAGGEETTIGLGQKVKWFLWRILETGRCSEGTGI